MVVWQQLVVPDCDEAPRQNVKEEAADEFVGF